ncbi:MAG: dipeptidyl-peptidase-4 [Paraglaciecola sp.]|jgi:dipeptidyl-peptidase-4
MGSVELTDQIGGVKFLRTLPYVDETRIGVYGLYDVNGNV